MTFMLTGQAAAELSARGLAHIILLGAPDKVMAYAHKLNVDLSKVRPRAYNMQWLYALLELAWCTARAGMVLGAMMSNFEHVFCVVL